MTGALTAPRLRAEPNITSAGVPQDILVALAQTFVNGTYPGPPLPVHAFMLDACVGRVCPRARGMSLCGGVAAHGVSLRTRLAASMRASPGSQPLPSCALPALRATPP